MAEAEGEPAKPVVDPEEEGAEEHLEEEPINDDDGDSDAESEVINLPYPTRVSAHLMGPTGPTPPWGIDLLRRSREQGQRPPVRHVTRVLRLEGGRTGRSRASGHGENVCGTQAI